MPLAIAFSLYSIKELLRIYNKFASERGFPQLKGWRDSRCKLVERVALIRTQPIPPVKPELKQPKLKKRKQPVRDAMLAALAFVSHYEDSKSGEKLSKREGAKRDPRTVFSVGLPYDEVRKRIQKKFPDRKISGVFLRLTATMVRRGEAGHENCRLPQKRPHSTKGTSQ